MQNATKRLDFVFCWNGVQFVQKIGQEPEEAPSVAIWNGVATGSAGSDF